MEKYKHLNKPMFVFLHQLIPYTLAGTDLPYYRNGIIQVKELTDLLSQYDNIFSFSGHSHWSLREPKMLIEDPFVITNSSSVYNTYGSDGKGHETIIDVEGSQGLYITVYPDKIRLQGRDFKKQAWVEEYDYIIHLKMS